MREGDLVLTPSWAMARPRQRNGETVVWMDGLDVPLTKALQLHLLRDCTASGRCRPTKPVNDSQAMYGHGRLSPTWMKAVSKISPLLLYSWEQTTEALRALRDRDGSPYEGVALEYTHPKTGGPVAADHRLAGCSSSVAGERLRARRVHRQRRLLRRAGKGPQHHRRQAIRLEQGATSSRFRRGRCTSTPTPKRRCDPLFQSTDRPVIEALGFYREESARRERRPPAYFVS